MFTYKHNGTLFEFETVKEGCEITGLEYPVMWRLLNLKNQNQSPIWQAPKKKQAKRKVKKQLKRTWVREFVPVPKGNLYNIIWFDGNDQDLYLCSDHYHHVQSIEGVVNTHMKIGVKQEPCQWCENTPRVSEDDAS